MVAVQTLQVRVMIWSFLVLVLGCSPLHKGVGAQFFSHSCTIRRHLQRMKHLGISNCNQAPKAKLQGKVLPKDPEFSGYDAFWTLVMLDGDLPDNLSIKYVCPGNSFNCIF